MTNNFEIIRDFLTTQFSRLSGCEYSSKVDTFYNVVLIGRKKDTPLVIGKVKSYTITLKNSNGKVVSKAKVYLKIKGKTYKAYTNSKGKATFKITKLTTRGKYTATIKFSGSKYYSATSKKVYITTKR